MNTTQGIIYQTSSDDKKNSQQNLPALVAALLDQADFAFPEITKKKEWKDMPAAQKKSARRELFRLLYGNSPEFLALKLRLQQKTEGGANE